MAEEFDLEAAEIPGYLDGLVERRSGAEHPRLPLQPTDEKGRLRHPVIRDHAEFGRPHTPVRDADGKGPKRTGGRPRLRNDAGDGGGLPSGHDRYGLHRKGDGLEGLQPAQVVADTQLADVSDGHWSPSQEAASETASLGLRLADGVFDASGGLETLTKLSLERLKEILELPVPVQELQEFGEKIHRNVIAFAKIQLGAVERVLTTQTRVDETKLRRATVDALPKLLARVRAEQAKLGLPVIDGEVLPTLLETQDTDAPS